MNVLKSVMALALFVFVTGCGKENVNPTPLPEKFELYIDFWNPNGNDPQISFDKENSSPEIKIDFTKTFAGIAVPPNFTNVIIENVRLIDENNINYRIDEINAYEWREDINDWKQDVEFVMQFDQVQDIAVVLVLDASASLGEDFETIKNYATEFISQILSQNKDAQIGIVSFSDQISSFGMTNNQTALNSYISSIEQGPFTSMYEAMDMGIDMLLNTNAESKAIMTFTDGTDNNSSPGFTPASIIEKLSSDPNSAGITSFTIGLEGNGGVDKPVLEALSANNGQAAFPNTLKELGEVFQGFSESISTVYNLTYIRNQQIIPTADPAKLRFVFESTPKQQ
jgi:Ca-activated chloride channel homolog